MRCRAGLSGKPQLGLSLSWQKATEILAEEEGGIPGPRALGEHGEGLRRQSTPGFPTPGPAWWNACLDPGPPRRSPHLSPQYQCPLYLLPEFSKMPECRSQTSCCGLPPPPSSSKHGTFQTDRNGLSQGDLLEPNCKLKARVSADLSAYQPCVFVYIFPPLDLAFLICKWEIIRVLTRYAVLRIKQMRKCRWST